MVVACCGRRVWDNKTVLQTKKREGALEFHFQVTKTFSKMTYSIDVLVRGRSRDETIQYAQERG